MIFRSSGKLGVKVLF